MFNHIDCRVIQGFPALRKAQTIHVKKIRCFFTCLWYSQSAANTSLAFRARLMNERRSPHHSQPVAVCQNFLGLWLLKHWKIRIAYRHWLSKFRWSGRKTKIRRKKPKVTNSATLIMAFLAAENENRQLEDLPQAAFGCVPERHLLLVRTESINENFVYWKLRPLLNL